MSRYPLFPDARGSRFSSLVESGTVAEPIPNIEEEPHLIFGDAKGKIRAGCYFGEHRLTSFDLGMVPDEVASQGANAVRAYADSRMRELIEKERKRREDRATRIQELYREYEIRHDGVLIRGFVKKDKDNGPRADFMKLTMTEPFQLEGLLYVSPQCWADAMYGNRSFDGEGNLTEKEIECQKKTLIAWYKGECRKRRKPPAHPVLADLRSARSDLDDKDDD